MNIIASLKQDHKNIAHILAQISHTQNEEHNLRVSLYKKLEKALLTHTQYEENIFYPALRNKPKLKDTILEAYQEHHVIEHIIVDASHVSFDHDVWKAKITVLKENIEHHVKEEEEEIFPKVQYLLSAEELTQMAQEYHDFISFMKK